MPVIELSDNTKINGLLNGTSWTENAGEALTMTYSFVESSSDFSPNGSETVTSMSTKQRQDFKEALSTFSDIANITFTETNDIANPGYMRVGMYTGGDSLIESAAGFSLGAPPSSLSEVTSGAHAYYGNLMMNSVHSSDMSKGKDGFHTTIHELGHSLGLKHSFDEGDENSEGVSNDTLLPRAEDSYQYTAMSYNNGTQGIIFSGHGHEKGATSEALVKITSSLQLYDIAAIQYLYGANTNTKTGNDIYTFNTDAELKSIWDAGGTDTFDLSNQTLDAKIDLTAGSFSSIGGKGYKFDTTEQTAVATNEPAENNISVAYNVDIENVIGGSGSDSLTGNALSNEITGGAGNDTISGGDGNDTAIYTSNLTNYKLTKSGDGLQIISNSTSEGTDSLTSVERIKFQDFSINLNIQDKAKSIAEKDLTRIEELYIAFFNRTPDADGLEYWVDQFKSGKTTIDIAESFYNAGIQYSDITGYSSSMTNDDFIKIVYKNVLGRDTVDQAGLDYWNNQLNSGTATRGSLVDSILNSAHTYKNDATYGWVVELLEKKAEVSTQFAVNWGLNYNTPEESISKGIAISAAIKSDSTTEAINLIGVDSDNLQIV